MANKLQLHYNTATMYLTLRFDLFTIERIPRPSFKGNAGNLVN